MSDNDETTEARLEALESLVRRALSGGGADAPLLGDVTGPESATVLSKIAALAGGGTVPRTVDVNNAGNVVAGPSFQFGTSQIVVPNGSVDIVAVITANSRILVTGKDMNPGGGGNITQYFEIPAATRVIGSPGSFRVRVRTDNVWNVTNTNDLSTFDWIVINP